MRKFTAFLAVLACLYSPFRFGLIILDEADRLHADVTASKTWQKNPAGEDQYKKIVEPGKYLRRPFSSKDKNFTLKFDPKFGRYDWTMRQTEIPEFLFSAQTIFSHLRAPPYPSSSL